MRLNRQAETGRRVPPAFTFICNGCEAVEHRRTPALPEHWVTREASDDIVAYCGGCADDVAGHEGACQ